MKKRRYEKIGAADIETNRIDGGPLYFDCGCFYSEKKTFSTWSEKDYLDFLLSCNEFDCIYFHNGGKFDTLWVIDALARYYPHLLGKVSVFMRGSSVLMLEIMGVTFLDSLAILPGKLEDVSQAILGEGKKGSFEDEGERKIEYCMEDCRILYWCIKRFFEKVLELGGQPKMTVASIAMNIWQSMHGHYMPQYRHIKRAQDVFSIERESYSGGRTEVFKKHPERPYNLYDINSMYPSVMKDAFIPVGKPRLAHKYTSRYIENEGSHGLARVSIYMPECIIPPTWNRREDGRLIFPYGWMQGTYTLPELRYFLECGAIINKCEFVLLYRSEQIFQEYVTTFHNERLKAKKEKDAFRTMLYKLFLNSLYGKYGERETGKQLYFGCPPEGAKMQCDNYVEGFHGTPIFVSTTTTTKRHVHPIISSYITSLARVALHRLANLHPEDLIYCDTDSLHTFAEYPVDPYELGELDFEGRVTRGEYIAPKMYRLELDTGEIKQANKGFSKFIEIDGKKERFEMGIGKKQNKYTVNTLKTMLKKDVGFGSVKTEKVVLTPKNEKRIFDGQGNSRAYKLE